MGVSRHHITGKAVGPGQRKYSLSTEQTGTGAAQSVAHGLGVVPSLVMIIITGSPGTYAALSVTEGTHTSTNVVVTVTSGWKFKVYAEA